MTAESAPAPRLEASAFTNSVAFIINQRIVCNLRIHVQFWGLSFLTESHLDIKNGAQLRRHSHHVLMSTYKASAAFLNRRRKLCEIIGHCLLWLQCI